METVKEKKFQENRERVILAGVDIGNDQEEFDRSMRELAELAKACDMEPIGNR